MKDLTPLERVRLKAEPRSFSVSTPNITPDNVGTTADYATALLQASIALRELEEAIPNGQHERTARFLHQLAQASDDLGRIVLDNIINKALNAKYDGADSSGT